MKITRCDRCGGDVKVLEFAAGTQPKISDLDRVVVYNTDFKADLCAECMHAFIDWIGMRELIGPQDNAQ